MEIELKCQLFVGKMFKEQKDLLKDMVKIKNVKGGVKWDQRKLVQMIMLFFLFLVKEKVRLQVLRENVKVDEY